MNRIRSLAFALALAASLVIPSTLDAPSSAVAAARVTNPCAPLERLLPHLPPQTRLYTVVSLLLDRCHAAFPPAT